MARLEGKLIIHGVGGAGINIASDVLRGLENYNEISDIEIYTLDSTDKTIQKHPELEETFMKITSGKRSGTQIDGAAGERKNTELVKIYSENVKNYMDEFEFTKPNTNEFHVVIFSGSGGTGSVAGPLLIQELIQTGNIVYPIVIGDASNLLFITNTINTLSTIERIATKNKVAIPFTFYNNTINGVTNMQTEKEINNRVIKMLYLISIGISGNIQNIDLQDMRNFMQPSLYKTIRVQNGAYGLHVVRKTLDVEDAIIARTVTTEEFDIDIKSDLLHNKVGILLSEEAIETLGDQLPVYLYLRTNTLVDTVEELEETYEKLEEKTRKKRRSLRSNLNNVEDDDTGLVL